LSENLKGRYLLEGIDADRRIMLKWMLKKWVVMVWTGFM
jgi:hypothetical protein